jgi:acetyl-CoA acyltransferase 1
MASSERLSRVLGHVESEARPVRNEYTNNYISKSPDDIVIVECKRTPLCRARKGGFKDTLSVDLMVPVFKAVLKGIDPTLVSEVVVGTVLPISTHRHIECRQACFLAGMPVTTTIRTVNRQCSSGLQAMADVASDIQSGFYDVGIAAGVETMTQDGAMMKKPPPIGTSVKVDALCRDALLPMGITSENVAKRFGVSREDQDQLAMMSHARAAAAKTKFQAEIVPVKTIFKDPKTNKASSVTIYHDDGVRPGTTMATLAKLRPAFKKTGSTTAGNASQTTDGAAAALMMKRSKAQELGLKVKAVFKDFAVSGVDPSVMGIGPAYAIPDVLKRANMSLDDIDLFEINEAFASQAVYCVKKLGLSMDNVNVNGGAIALGHPLGCTGVRMAATLLHEMERRGDKRGIVSMCIGTGMGAAAIFERD